MTTPTIQEIAPQRAIVARAQVAPDGFKDLVDQTFPALFSQLGQLGATPVAPPFIRYLGFGELISVQLGVPVAEDAALGEADVDTLPGGRAAVLRHVGSYDGLEAAGRSLQAWVRERGEDEGDSFWESYVTDPGSEPDASKWVTEIVIPLRS